MTTAAKMDRLVALFGSATEIATAAGVNRAAVSRWRAGRFEPKPIYKARLLKEAKRRRLDRDEVAGLLGVARCECCGAPIDRAVREALK